MLEAQFNAICTSISNSAFHSDLRWLLHDIVCQELCLSQHHEVVMICVIGDNNQIVDYSSLITLAISSPFPLSFFHYIFLVFSYSALHHLQKQLWFLSNRFISILGKGVVDSDYLKGRNFCRMKNSRMAKNFVFSGTEFPRTWF